MSLILQNTADDIANIIRIQFILSYNLAIHHSISLNTVIICGQAAKANFKKKKFHMEMTDKICQRVIGNV